MFHQGPMTVHCSTLKNDGVVVRIFDHSDVLYHWAENEQLCSEETINTMAKYYSSHAIAYKRKIKEIATDFRG